MTADSCEWKIINCTGDIPLERAHHAACAISAEKMLIFGGYYTSKLRFNDTYILKTSIHNYFLFFKIVFLIAKPFIIDNCYSKFSIKNLFINIYIYKIFFNFF